ncbi:hypothetical protein [Tardiphaga sp. 367_B4_N1_1]|uniref:hypothetical protein n=1 Tax=Tardiphaga sp. 367_B4_N1_1 TaxID=3240777 RepID=UPI003F1F2532
MRQRYDLLAFSLLAFAALFAAWLGIFGPPDRASIVAFVSDLQRWQVLCASFVALAAACIAYNAAMAKVRLDERLVSTTSYQKDRGIYLRVRLALFLMTNEANAIAKWFDLPKDPDEVRILKPDHAKLSTLEDLEEAWRNLEIFPYQVAVYISDIRINCKNVTSIASQFETEGTSVAHQADPRISIELYRIRFYLSEIATMAVACEIRLGELLDNNTIRYLDRDSFEAEAGVQKANRRRPEPRSQFFGGAQR